MTLRIDIVTLFPAMLEGPLDASIPARIQDHGLAEIRVHDLRELGDRASSVGRRPAVWRGSRDDHPTRAGRGRPGGAPRPGLDGDPARPGRRAVPPGPCVELATRDHLILLCPRYEGVDDRVRALVDVELSIGDYVLTGGELPALVVVDAVLRLLPGAIDAESTLEESFADGLLEYPQFTRPATFEGRGVPAILTSGDHAAVRRWRHREAIRRTLERRPDLLIERSWTPFERVLLDELRAEADEQDDG